MTTNYIRFSHNYNKLHVLDTEKEAKLLECINVKMEDLSNHFLKYDAEDKFNLPTKGKYLLLIFKGSQGIFTTLRRWHAEKERYYRCMIGKSFTIEIN